MEAFEGLDLGTVVTVGDNSNVWEKVAEGWSRAGITLPPVHFAGDVANNRVTIGARPEAGQLWSDAGAPNYGYSYVLIEQQENTWWAVRLYEDRYYSINQISQVPGRLVADRPAWADLALAMGRQYVAVLRDRDTYRTALNEARVATTGVQTELNTLRSEVQRGLHALVRNDDKLRESVDAILEPNGMRRCDQIVKVTAKVRIHRYVNIPVETMTSVYAAEGIENARAMEPLRVVANYETDMEFDVEGEAGACACRLVSRSHVRNRLREMGTDFYDYALLDTTCENGHPTLEPMAAPAF